VKEVRYFSGHAGFYSHFIKDFSRIAKPLTNLLTKHMSFHFSEECLVTFTILKEALTSTLILHPPIWGELFELMYDASNYVVDVFLEQLVDKKPYVIYYASNSLTDAQLHYTVTEKELLGVIFSFKKFKPYLIRSHGIIYTDHYALKHLLF